MKVVRILVIFVLFVALTEASPLKKEVLGLPSLFHLSDTFNLQKSKDQLEVHSVPRTWIHTNPWLLYQVLQTSYPDYLSYPTYSSYPSYPLYPGWSTGTQPGYPQTGFPAQPAGYPAISYPSYPAYPAYPTSPAYPPYPSYPRKYDIDLVEHYYKFNDDGSKEHKIVLSNDLTIYQKVLNKPSDKQNIELLETYYSARQDDNTYLTTYFRADENGYSASSELTDSPPTYPNVSQMMRLSTSTK